MISSIHFIQSLATLLVVYAHIEISPIISGHFPAEVLSIISGFIITPISGPDASALLHLVSAAGFSLFFSLTLMAIAMATARTNRCRFVDAITSLFRPTLSLLSGDSLFCFSGSTTIMNHPNMSRIADGRLMTNQTPGISAAWHSLK